MNDHFQSAFGAFGQGNVFTNILICGCANIHSAMFNLGTDNYNIS